MSYEAKFHPTKTAAELAAENPYIGEYEIAVASDTGDVKIGPGRWNGLGYAGRAVPAVETLTDGATITWTFNGNESRNAKVTLGGNRTLALSGCQPGASGTLIVVQGAGGQTLALPSGSYVVNAGAGVATLSSGAADRDVLSFLYVSSTEIYWTVGLDFTSA